MRKGYAYIQAYPVSYLKSMITFISTTKPFKGLSKVHQLNAINSWLMVHPDSEIILFHPPEDLNLIDSDRVVFVEEMETSESGVPMINYMFDKGSELARHEICCFANADIVIPPTFVDIVVQARKLSQKNFLFVGQRKNFDSEELIDFSKENWYEFFLKKHSHQLSWSAGTGSEYFVFPKGQYNMQNMPSLLVGRPGWDLWMAYFARKQGYETVDLTPSLAIFHQNHDYSHKTKDTKLREIEDFVNYQYLPDNHRYTFTPVHTSKMKLKSGRLLKNHARRDWIKKIAIESGLHPDSLFWRVLYKLSRIYLTIRSKILRKW